MERRPLPMQSPLLALKPADTPDYMTQAWVDFLRWAFGVKELIDQFRAETGNYWTPATTPIDQMIDNATGANREFCEEYIKWLNHNVWGPCD